MSFTSCLYLIGQMMKHFAVFKQNCIMARSDLSISGVAVDDCATECLMEELFDCQSFVYCPGEGLCLLNRLHPDLNQTLVQPHKFCNLYISMPLILPSRGGRGVNFCYPSDFFTVNEECCTFNFLLIYNL